MYYSLLYVIFSKNSFSLLSVLGVCRSSEKRVQRYRFSQYPPNFYQSFLKKKYYFSTIFTKRENSTLLYIIEPFPDSPRQEGSKNAGEYQQPRRRCIAATYRTQHNKRLLTWQQDWRTSGFALSLFSPRYVFSVFMSKKARKRNYVSYVFMSKKSKKEKLCLLCLYH